MFHEISPRKLNIAYINKEAVPSDYVIITLDNSILINSSESLSFPKVSEIRQSCKLQFLFSVDDVNFHMLCDYKVNAADCLKDDFKELYSFTSVRNLRNLEPMWLAYSGTLGYRLIEWYRSVRFCGACGSSTIHSSSERAVICPHCSHISYPTISPSVIVLIRNGEKILLTKYQPSHNQYAHYALVAGYVESGETPEECVKREIFEEVGLKVKNIEYYKSQPWPLSGALLLGFICDLDGDDTVTMDSSELSVAEWIPRSEVPVRDRDVSLTSELMENFRKGIL